MRYVCLFILLTAGCAVPGTQTVHRNFSFENYKNKAIVAFTVSHDVAGARAANAVFYINSETSNSKRAHSGPEESAGMMTTYVSELPGVNGKLWVFDLPPGRHALTTWEMRTGTGVRIHPRHTPPPLSFEVRAGEAVYIGNLHLNLATAPGILGGETIDDGYPEIKDHSHRDIPIFEHRYARMKGQLKVELLTLGPWFRTKETFKKMETLFIPVFR